MTYYIKCQDLTSISGRYSPISKVSHETCFVPPESLSCELTKFVSCKSPYINRLLVVILSTSTFFSNEIVFSAKIRSREKLSIPCTAYDTSKKWQKTGGSVTYFLTPYEKKFKKIIALLKILLYISFIHQRFFSEFGRSLKYA